MAGRIQIGINPILVKELRSRMRDARAFVTLTLVLLLLGGISYLLYRIMIAATAYSSMPVSPQIGQSLFIALVFMLLLMVSAIAPAVTAGAISSEKEKLTYEMLLVTPLHAGSILWGKLISALTYVFLLIFAAIPMASLIFIFGGVAVWDMVKALVILVSVAVMFGMLGMFMSALLGRTPLATVMSYLVVGALYIGPLITFIAVGVINQAEPPRWLLVPSPMSAVFSAISTPANIGYMGGMDFLWSISTVLGGNLNALTGSNFSIVGIPRPLYQYSLPLFALLTLVFYFLSSRLVLPTRRWKLTKRDLLMGIGLLLLFSTAVGAFFLSTTNRYERAASLTANPNFQVMEPARGVAVEKAVVVERLEAPPPVPPPYPDPEDIINPYPAPGSETASETSENETVEIYTYAIRQILEETGWTGRLLYLVNATSLGAEDQGPMYIDLEDLDIEVRDGIVHALDDLAINEIVWIKLTNQTDLTPILVDPTHAVVVVDDIYYFDDSNSQVAVSFHTQRSSTGNILSFTKIDGKWTIE
jgi:ABC-2 type transport system permease protein